MENDSKGKKTKREVQGGTWTHNLFLRRETPYPLGHMDLLFVEKSCWYVYDKFWKLKNN